MPGRGGGLLSGIGGWVGGGGSPIRLSPAYSLLTLLLLYYLSHAWFLMIIGILDSWGRREASVEGGKGNGA